MIVYLDTNVYKAAKYIFDTGKLEAIKKLVKDGEIVVLYTDATIGEVYEHIREDITEQVNKYNKVVRKDLLTLKENGIYDISELDIEETIIKTKQKLTEFLELDNVKKIPLNPIDADKLFDDYFSKRPPFENKKPYEFKDAIMINAIKNYQNKIKQPICIVSNDNGFRNSFQKSEFIVFNFLGDFLKYCSEKIAKRDCVQDAIEYGRLDNVIIDYLKNCDVEIDHHIYGSYDDLDILETNCELLYLKESEGEINFLISCDSKLVIDVEYLDETMSYYDKEESRYIIENYIKDREKHEINIELTVVCDVIENENKEILLENFKIIEINNFSKIIELDDNTLLSSERLDTTYSDEFCSQCGKKLINDSINQDYSGNLLCNNCMKADEDGDICPECSRKIPHKYMISGLCEECYNKRDGV